MSEKCPLEKQRLYWFGEIPDVCRDSCGLRWEEAEATTTPTEDLIDTECNHTLEHGGATLERDQSPKRYWTILSSCIVTGDDVLNETYFFECSNDKIN